MVNSQSLSSCSTIEPGNVEAHGEIGVRLRHCTGAILAQVGFYHMLPYAQYKTLNVDKEKAAGSGLLDP